MTTCAAGPATTVQARTTQPALSTFAQHTAPSQHKHAATPTYMHAISPSHVLTAVPSRYLPSSAHSGNTAPIAASVSNSAIPAAHKTPRFDMLGLPVTDVVDGRPLPGYITAFSGTW